MGSHSNDDRALERALARLIDGEPEPADVERLAESMQSDPAFAMETRRLLAVDEALRQHFQANGESFVEGVGMQIVGGQDRDLVTRLDAILPPAPAARSSWVPWLIAACACLVAVAQAVLRLNAPPVIERDAPIAKSERANESQRSELQPVVALLINSADAKFDERGAPDEVRFRQGIYELKRGVVHLRFLSGADVVIPAPARFHIQDPLHMRLEEGSLRALVSSEARGFTVDAPGVRYEDLGTEFGVSIGPGGKRSEVHVFEGVVDLKSPDGKKLSSLSVGASASVVEGRIENAPPPNLSLFPTPAMIGFQKWILWSSRLRTDPTIIRQYSFDARDDLSKLPDAAGGPDGTIQGARWVSGRWPGKQGLLFDGPDDAVSVDLDGDFRELTITAWIRPERFDFELNSIFDSDSWEEGDIHLQVDRNGLPNVGFFSNHGYSHDATIGVAAGQWTHIAAVVSLDREWSGVYVDGMLSNTTQIQKPDLRLRPGACRIGNWLRRSDWNHAPERGFRGRIDELTIWSRALGEVELREHVELGRPSILRTVVPLAGTN